MSKGSGAARAAGLKRSAPASRTRAAKKKPAWFGGFMPLTAAWLVARTGNVLSGLWYPIVVALLTAVIGAVWLPERHGDA